MVYLEFDYRKIHIEKERRKFTDFDITVDLVTFTLLPL